MGRMLAWAAGVMLLLVATPALALSASADFDRAAAAMKAALMSDPMVALNRAGDAQRLALSLGSARERDIALATVERLEGEAYVQIDRSDLAAPILARALMLARRSAPGTRLEAEILTSSGGVHASRAESAAAFADYEAAHHIFQKIGDARGQSSALLFISSLYGDANDFNAALKYLDQAIAASSGDNNFLMSIYANRASNLRELGRYAEAEAGYRKALALARTMNQPLFEARILGNIARLRLKLGDVSGADVLVSQGLALAHGDGAEGVRLPLIAIAAQAAYQHGDYRRAARLIEERFAGVDLDTTTIVFREAHQTAYDIYRALGDAPRAVAHLAALKRLDDQATRLATSANSALAAARFDFANQQLRYERQRAHIQRLIFLGAAIATAIIIALLGVWLVTLRRSRNRVKAVADDLAITNAALGKALAAKTEFLATTSHEIRTPLNGILGMTQVMLADPKLAADTRDRIGVVHGAGVTMRALVDDILDVAKMETGNLTVEHAPFDLAATLTDAARMWKEQANAKGVGFTLDLADSPVWIEGDAARVRQIAFNLLSNALKFTSQGQVALRVTRDGGRYRLAVTDTGIGIAADKHEDIFESFKQADAGTTRQFGGTGLGLAICRNLARAMGGDIEVVSAPGEGSTFTAVLPLVTAEAPAGARKQEAAACAAAGRVVIVDANPITRAMLKTLITARDPGVVAVTSLDQASAPGAEADLILIDQSAITDEIALTAFAGAAPAPITILWRGEAPAAVAQAGRVIVKPVAGPALLAQLFDSLSEQPPCDQQPQSPLVHEAA